MPEPRKIILDAHTTSGESLTLDSVDAFYEAVDYLLTAAYGLSEKGSAPVVEALENARAALSGVPPHV